MIYALIAVLIILALLTLGRLHKMAATLTDVLALTTAVKTQIDAIVVAPPAEDLQPAVDALTGIQADLTTKFPPAAT